jgi:pimeloyl-ACP methyl ester carboxylesterase
VVEHPPAAGWDGYDGPVVVLVHGSLDRGTSFLRTVRRLPEWGLVTYDRRGYQGSRPPSPRPGEPGPRFARHVEDLLGVAAAVPGGAGGGGRNRVRAVGHSVGGNVVMGAALADPGAFASIGAFEPPLPWLGFRRGDRAGDPAPDVERRWSALAEDPAEEAERFFRRMVGDATWERLPEAMREERRADGPALVADLLDLRGDALFDATALRVPVAFGCSDALEELHHRRIVEWLAEHVEGAEMVEITGAGHGAHLSHPDAFADLVRRVVLLAGPAR